MARVGFGKLEFVAYVGAWECKLEGKRERKRAGERERVGKRNKERERECI